MSARSQLAQFLAAQTHTQPSSDMASVVSRLFRGAHLIASKATDDAGAATATTELQGFALPAAMYPDGCTCVGLLYVPNGTITADAANQGVITVTKRTSAGATLTTLGTLTTNLALGNLVQGQNTAFALTATVADLTIAAGSTLGWAITKNGAGVVMRAGQILGVFEGL